jgi:oligopeptide/dipeptide ABC transporter ATP-binding protein
LTANPTSPAFLRVSHLKKFFPIHSGFFSRENGSVKAVDDVSFDIEEASTLGLVGESGCGKTTVGRTMLRLLSPSGGEVLFRGQDILKMNAADLRTMRRKMQIVFQDPYSSLNPRITVGAMLEEILKFHRIEYKGSMKEKIASLFETVGMAPEYASRYPHEFSGGQRQRIGIVRALAVEPEFMVLDEPVSALDVSIQAQILNLLKDLQTRYRISYLFISHALSVVEHISKRTAVMYLGRVVEMGETDDIISRPLHPYSKALLASVPRTDPSERANRHVLEGDVPSPANPPSGCHFHPRCPSARPECKTWTYNLKPVDGSRQVACLLYE